MAGVSAKKIPALVRVLRTVTPALLNTSAAWIEYFDNRVVQEFIQINQHNDINYFNKEQFEELLDWIFFFTIVQESINADNKISAATFETSNRVRIVLKQCARDARYKFDLFLEQLPSNLISKKGE